MVNTRSSLKPEHIYQKKEDETTLVHSPKVSMKVLQLVWWNCHVNP